jgi:hypothetical protein
VDCGVHRACMLPDVDFLIHALSAHLLETVSLT